MPPMHRNRIVIATRLLFALLTLGAIARQCMLHMGAGLPVANFFSYFTILSNGMAGGVLLLGAYMGVTRATLPAWYERARLAAAIYMAVVGIVFATLLRDADLGTLLPWINTVHHYVMPLAMIVDWGLLPPMRALTWGDVTAALVFPVLYLGYTLVRGASTGWYPYPFLNPALVGGYATVSVYVAAIVVVFVVLGAALRWSAGKSRARVSQRSARM